ncbi:MAG TPA: ABC transporter substrate-binding protein [Dermatophilaceae bacterium]|nr:ABC transporter substrate-binding protein [Dermatophilaceae bacterium]
MKRTTATVTLATAGLLALTACGGSSDPLSTSSATPTTSGSSAAGKDVVVGSADFSESVLLAEIYAGALRAKGVNASTKTNIGSREIYLKALQDGSVQVLPEYTGALALYYDPNFTKTDAEEVYTTLQTLIPSDFALLAKSAAEDNDSINVSKETAQAKSLKTIEDLAPVAGTLALGAPPEFKTRAQGIPGLEKTYGVTFQTFRPLKGQALIQALKNGQIDAANIFSTDPAIAANGFVTLEDTKRVFGSQNIVPLVRRDVADQVRAPLDAVSGALTTEKLSSLLKLTDIDKKDPKAVAEQFLTENNLG